MATKAMSDMTAPDEVRWFDKTGPCKGDLKRGGCFAPAVGVLRGPRNESYGPYCQKCGDKRLKDAKAEREKYDAELTRRREGKTI